MKIKGFVLISTNGGSENNVEVSDSAALALLQKQYGDEQGRKAFVNLVTNGCKCASVAGSHMLEFWQ